MKSLKNNKFLFECQKCGSCCSKKIKGYTYLEIEELYRLSKNLNISLETLLDKYIEIRDEIFNIDNKEIKFKVFVLKQNNGKCVFLKNKECSIHDFKPFICRIFPFFNEIFDKEEKFKAYYTHCKGFGKGKEYLKKEITEQLELEKAFTLKLYKISNFLNLLKLDEIIKDIKVKFENENQKFEESALEMIKKGLILESIKKYPRKTAI